MPRCWEPKISEKIVRVFWFKEELVHVDVTCCQIANSPYAACHLGKLISDELASKYRLFCHNRSTTLSPNLSLSKLALKLPTDIFLVIN